LHGLNHGCASQLFFAVEMLVQTGFGNAHFCSHFIDRHGIKAFFSQKPIDGSRDSKLSGL
jgi:hypothetical protein